jgi:hypothetical protein
MWTRNMGLLDDLWAIADGHIPAPERPQHRLRFKEEVRREFKV